MRTLFWIILSMVSTFGMVAAEQSDTIRFVYKLHGQTRRFDYVFSSRDDGGVTLSWSIERNLKLWKGTYEMSPEAVASGSSLSFVMPEDGNHVRLKPNKTFAMISRDAYRELKDTGRFVYDGVRYAMPEEGTGQRNNNLLHVVDEEGAELWILDDLRYPLIVEMRNNPLEINWKATINRQ